MACVFSVDKPFLLYRLMFLTEIILCGYAGEEAYHCFKIFFLWSIIFDYQWDSHDCLSKHLKHPIPYLRSLKVLYSQSKNVNILVRFTKFDSINNKQFFFLLNGRKAYWIIDFRNGHFGFTLLSSSKLLT